MTQKKTTKVIKTKNHLIELKYGDEHFVTMCVDNVLIAVHTNYDFVPDQVTVFTSNVQIQDFSGNKNIILKETPSKKFEV